MEKELLTLALILVSFELFGQSVSRSVIPAAGDDIRSEKGVTVSWTIGESFNEMKRGTYHVTEGFQQGNLSRIPSVMLFAERLPFNKMVLLTWKVKNPHHVKSYLIQRKLDNEEEYTTIYSLRGEVKSATFQLEDNNTYTGEATYRIRYLYEAEQLWSNNAEIEAVENKMKVTLLPNPVRTEMIVRFDQAPTARQISFEIVDKNGQVVRTMIYNTAGGKNEFLITDLGILSSGVYWLRGMDEKGKVWTTISFLKLK